MKCDYGCGNYFENIQGKALGSTGGGLTLAGDLCFKSTNRKS